MSSSHSRYDQQMDLFQPIVNRIWNLSNLEKTHSYVFTEIGSILMIIIYKNSIWIDKHQCFFRMYLNKCLDLLQSTGPHDNQQAF
jgi:hypothetical protein